MGYKIIEDPVQWNDRLLKNSQMFTHPEESNITSMNMYIEAVLIAGFALLSYAHPRHLTVDLGYENYTGVYNDSTDLNVWKGWVPLIPAHLASC